MTFVTIPVASLLLNACSASIGLCMVFHFLPRILHAIEKKQNQNQNHACVCTCAAAAAAIKTIEEPLFITTEDAQELREIVENSPTEATPTEETAEFADLLAEKKDN